MITAKADAGWYGDDEGTLPLGAPFRPGLDPLPRRQHAWAVIKDDAGRPAHDEPRVALHRVTIPVPEPAPSEAIGYVLYAGLTYNTLFAARGVPISVFDLHDRDLHVPGSGAVVLVAALGSDVAREARLKTGELRVSCRREPGRIRCTRTSRSRGTRRRTARSASSCAARPRSCWRTPNG
jgi:hypothetical protein